MRPAFEDNGESDVSALYSLEFRRFAGICDGAPEHSLRQVAVGRVRGSDFCEQVTHAVKATADCNLAFRFGAAIGGRAFGLLGISAATAPTLGQSLKNLLRWEPLTSTLGRIGISSSHHQLRVTWDAKPDVPGPVVEAVLSGWISFGRFLANEALPILSLELTHARSQRSDVESIVDCPVKFGARENAVVAPVGILDVRPRFADSTLHSSISRWLDDSMRAFATPAERLSPRLTHAIVTELESGEPRESGVAERLGFTPRTLQRHFAAYGTSYRRVLELLRANVALLHLSEGEGRLIDIAHSVGFHEQATLTRAVKRWTGRSPREIARLFGPDFAPLRV